VACPIVELYNTSALIVNASLNGVMDYAVTSTDGLFGHLVILAVWLIAFVITKSQLDSVRALAFASFVAFILAALFMFAGWASWQAALLLLIMLGISIAAIRG
jgi:hypothetical protein